MNRSFASFAALFLTLALGSSMLMLTPVTPAAPVKVQTRGPQRDLNTLWQLQLIERQREEQTGMMSLIFMQLDAPIRIDGTIPLWGVIGACASAIVTALIFGITLMNRLNSHETLDVSRFTSLEEKIDSAKEDLRQDLRELRAELREHN